MLVKQEPLNPCEIELEIEVEAEKVASAVDDAYVELGKKVNIPGFRKGKAPRVVLEQFLDKDRVHERAANKLMYGAYLEALEESELKPFAGADFELVKMEVGEPMVFKAKVPLAPKVELGEYVGLEIERPVPTVTDADVDEEIKRLLEHRATYTQVTDRPVREGDVVLVETKDESKPDQHPSREVAEIGKCLPAGFDQGVIGMQTGEEKVIEITYPEDYENEELRGKTVPLRVKIIEINEKHIPELTDEWVKETFAPRQEESNESVSDSDTIDTVEKLRSKVRAAMEAYFRNEADKSVREQIIRKVVDAAEVCFPSLMVEELVDYQLESLLEELEQRKVTLDEYLRYKKETLEELRERYAEEAREAIKIMLVLEEIARKENISVEDKDVDDYVRAMAEEREVPVATMNAYLEKTVGRDDLKHRITRKKVVDFLVHASNIKNVGGQKPSEG